MTYSSDDRPALATEQITTTPQAVRAAVIEALETYWDGPVTRTTRDGFVALVLRAICEGRR